jgi:hypothetical protein
LSTGHGEASFLVPVIRFPVAPETQWATAQTVYVNGGMSCPINRGIDKPRMTTGIRRRVAG